MNDVLFVGPDLSVVGGVSCYCDAIIKGYPGDLAYFPFPVSIKYKPLVFIGVLFLYIVRLIKIQCRIIHINTSLNNNAISRDAFFLLIALLLNRKIVVSIHGWDNKYAMSLTGFRLSLFRLIYGRSDLITVLSHEFMDNLKNMGVQSRIVVETTCYSDDITRFDVNSDVCADCDFNVLFVSRIIREKGVFELVDACALLQSDYPQLKLYIAGEGPDLADVRQYVASRDIDHVVFCGQVVGHDKCILFKSAKVLCLPSYSEGLPVTLLEALYFGLPVVTTRVGGIPSVIKEGVNGYFVEPGDVADLAAKIKTVLTDQESYARMARINLRYAAHFSPETVATRLDQYHRQLLQ